MSLPQEVADQIQLSTSAYISIDMQRRDVDQQIGYHLLDVDRTEAIVRAALTGLRAAREAGVPVVHIATYSRRPGPRGSVDDRNPFWKYQTGKLIPGMGRPRQSGKDVEGSVYAEILPALGPDGGEPVVVKRRYSGFFQTDLDLVLRGLGAETLFLSGVNTNNCVLATVYDAFSRDFRIVVLADACGSMNGDAYHEAALRQVETALGFVATVSEFQTLLAAKQATAPARGRAGREGGPA